MMKLRNILSSLLLIVLFLVVGGVVNMAHAKDIPWFHNQRAIVSWENVVLPEGSEVKHLIVIGGDATINGRVNDEVVVVDGNVVVGGTGYVKDNITVIGGTVKQASGSFVGKSVVSLELNGTTLLSLTVALILLAAMDFTRLALFLLIIGIPPLVVWWQQKRSQRLADVTRQYGRQNILFGLLWLLVFTAVEALLIVSVAGIPVAALLLLLVSLVVLYSLVGPALALGRWITAQLSSATAGPIQQAFYGGFGLALFTAIPIIGLICFGVLCLAGLGSVLVMFIKK